MIVASESSGERTTAGAAIQQLRSATSTEQLQRWHINVVEAMNVAPISVQIDCPLPRVHRLFRSMGLRHLVVVGRANEVVGMITREDLLTGINTR